MKAFRQFRTNPSYPGLEFKKLQGAANIYSARVGRHYRVVGAMSGSMIVWYWIGSHSAYDQIT
jgi:hypothetical protein